jgi:hypothetical protein
MNEKVYNKLMNLCEEFEGVAVSYLSDVNIFDIYNDRLYNDNKAYWILLQLCMLSQFKETIKKLKTYDIIANGMKEGEAE